MIAFAEHPGLVALVQDQPATDSADPAEENDAGPSTDGDDDDATVENHWRALEDIYSFSNLGGLLVALIAGWVPERLFR